MAPGEYDYSELRGRIKTVFGTQGAFAKAMGIAEATLSLKLGNKAEWSQNEMVTAALLLDSDIAKIPIYFFTFAV